MEDYPSKSVALDLGQARGFTLRVTCGRVYFLEGLKILKEGQVYYIHSLSCQKGKGIRVRKCMERTPVQEKYMERSPINVSVYIIVSDLGNLLKVMWRTIPARVLLLALAKQGDSFSGSHVGGCILGGLKSFEKEVKCIIFTL